MIVFENFPYESAIFCPLCGTKNIPNSDDVEELKELFNQNENIEKISWNPMKIIMKINLKWRIKLFNDKNASILLEEIIKEFSRYVNTKKSTPVFLWLPQKDDLIFIKKNFHFYKNFNKKIKW